MDIQEAIICRNDLITDSKDDNGFVQQQLILSQILPYLLDAKLVDSEDYTECYFKDDADNIKLNGYSINESGERLQLFIIDESTIQEHISEDKFFVSNRSDYESQIKRGARLVPLAIKGKLGNQLSDPIGPLASRLSSIEGIQQFDVIEIFLISLTATITRKSQTIQSRHMHFDNDSITAKYIGPSGNITKDFLLVKSVIDINFIFNVLSSRGNRQPLVVNFKKTFGYEIPVIEAAKEKNFESYLCVLNASILHDLYRQYSSRLLEKNVRSFLQFKGVNRGLKQTIRNEPERFIAYNNGVTLTAATAKVNERRRVYFIEALEDLQIVNGGQTVASIYFSRKEGLDISKVKVMAKINIVKSGSDNELEELISNISRYSNTQSKVSSVDLKSRNRQLVKLKQLSDSVVTPSGTKWFFERSRGEFNTKIRLAGSNASRIKRDYPPQKRFSKEQLAKYFSAWGDEPFLVKRGGEKVFRHFIERISPYDESPGMEINRTFYEELIAKIIMFRTFEKIYGAGKNSMGQLRSAAIPYSISIIFMATDGGVVSKFNFSKIWKDEGFNDQFELFSAELLELTNNLIKRYSKSEDFGEYSKREDLWVTIKKSEEVSLFLEKYSTVQALSIYTTHMR